MIGFDLVEYSVLEGGALEAMVNVESGIVLEREVVVAVESSDGIATGIPLQKLFVIMTKNNYECYEITKQIICSEKYNITSETNLNVEYTRLHKCM